MKKLLVLSAVMTGLSCTVAFASDDTIVQSQQGSIISFGCTTCDKGIVHDKPKLETGSQMLENFQVNGEDKVYRTENWLGGSPVSFVHYQQKGQSNGAAMANLDKPMKTDDALMIDESVVSSIDDNSDDIKVMTPDIDIMMDPQMVKNPLIEEPAMAKFADETKMMDMNPEPKMMEKPIIATMTETTNFDVELDVKPEADLEVGAFALRLN